MNCLADNFPACEYNSFAYHLNQNSLAKTGGYAAKLEILIPIVTFLPLKCEDTMHRIQILVKIIVSLPLPGQSHHVRLEHRNCSSQYWPYLYLICLNSCYNSDTQFLSRFPDFEVSSSQWRTFS